MISLPNIPCPQHPATTPYPVPSACTQQHGLGVYLGDTGKWAGSVQSSIIRSIIWSILGRILGRVQLSILGSVLGSLLGSVVQQAGSVQSSAFECILESIQ